MSSERKTKPIRRNGRKPGENQARRSQPGRYRKAWSKDVTNPPPGLRIPSYVSIDQVPSDLLERAMTKMVLVKRFVEEGCPRGKLGDYARAAAAQMNLKMDPFPADTTLRDWAKQFHHWGLIGLVDKVRRDQGISRTVIQDAREIALACVVGAKYGCGQALGFLARVLPSNEKMPSYHALHREIRRFAKRHPHLMAFVKEGLTGWQNRFRLALPGVEFPAGYRIAVDSTTADLMVRVRTGLTEVGWKPFRCVLTVVEDVGSRALLTFNLSFCSVDSGIALGTLRRAIVPGENYPGLPTIGWPHEVLVDTGPEHLSTFAQTLKDAGVDVKYTSGDPEDNGRIERVIDTIKTEILANLPGYVKTQKTSDRYRKEESDNRKNLAKLNYDPDRISISVMNLLTAQELETRILAWATVYNRLPHRSLKANSHFLKEVLEIDRLLERDAAA